MFEWHIGKKMQGIRDKVDCMVINLIHESSNRFFVCFVLGGVGGGLLSQAVGISRWDFCVLCISLLAWCIYCDLVHEILCFW